MYERPLENLASSPPPHSATEKLMQTSQKSPTNLKPADTTAAALAETNPNNNLLSKGLSAGGAGSPVPSHISPLPLTNLGTSIPLLSGWKLNIISIIKTPPGQLRARPDQPQQKALLLSSQPNKSTDRRAETETDCVFVSFNAEIVSRQDTSWLNSTVFSSLSTA